MERDHDLALNGKPLSTIDEFAGYVHKPLESHIGDASKDDLPVKSSDDGLDCHALLGDATRQPDYVLTWRFNCDKTKEVINADRK